MEKAVEGLAEKYARDISAEYMLGERLNSQGEAMLRDVARERAVRKLEELGGGL